MSQSQNSMLIDSRMAHHLLRGDEQAGDIDGDLV